MPVSKESELYEPLKVFFEQKGYEVKSEVRSCDLVAYRPEQADPVIVEMKKNLNITLLIQGVKRISMSPSVYIAVEYTPRSRKRHAFTWNDAVLLCRRAGLGLISVQFFKRRSPKIEVWCDPITIPAKKSPSKAKRLRDEFNGRSGDYHSGGITRQKLVTAYREKALRCANLMQNGEPVRLKDLREKLGDDKVSQIMQNNYYGWFARESRGKYRLTEKGVEALKDYAAVIENQPTI